MTISQNTHISLTFRKTYCLIKGNIQMADNLRNTEQQNKKNVL